MNQRKFIGVLAVVPSMAEHLDPSRQEMLEAAFARAFTETDEQMLNHYACWEAVMVDDLGETIS